ncbi:MAG: uroporphyrinogen decarboxylase family protein [Bacillota bacterium]|jgi:uroporphyrinogen decarboxylase|nr:methylcobamide--CoM methyltransferase [Clostridia bacterium]
MQINMDKWAQDIIDASEVKVMPILFFPIVPLVNKGVIEIVNDAQSHFEVMKAVIERYPAMIGSMTGMDLTKEAEAFGCQVKFTDTEAPSTEGGIVFDRASVESLQVPPNIQSGRAPVFIKAAAIASEYFNDRPVFGGVLGPFSLAAVLMGLSKAVKTLKKDPATLHILLEKCTEYIISYSKAYKEAGANGILLAEPTAGLLSPAQCEEFSSKYVKILVETVQDQGFFVILHNCGRVIQMVDSMVGTGAKGYSFGNAVDMQDILPQVPNNFLVFGNIDPSRMVNEKNPEVIKAETRDLLEKMKPFKNFILSSGCDLPFATPLNNINAFFEALKEYNQENKNC